jgi:hypothetical protein
MALDINIYAISVKDWLRRLPPDIVMNEMNKMVCLGQALKACLKESTPWGSIAPRYCYE